MLSKGKVLFGNIFRYSGAIMDGYDLIKEAVSSKKEKEGTFEQPSQLFLGELSKEQEQQSMYLNTLEVFKKIKNFLNKVDLTLPFNLDLVAFIGESQNQVEYNFELDLLIDLQEDLADKRQFATEEDQICEAFQTLFQILYSWLSLQLQQQNSEDRILNHVDYLEQLTVLLDNAYQKNQTYQRMRSKIVEAQTKVELTHLKQFQVMHLPISQTTLVIRNARNSCLKEFQSHIRFNCPPMLELFERELAHKINLTINSILQPYRSLEPNLQKQFYQILKNEFIAYLRNGQSQVSSQIVYQILAQRWKKQKSFEQVIRLIKLLTKDSEQFGELKPLIEIQNPEVQYEEYNKLQMYQQALPLDFKAMTQIFILMSGITVENQKIDFNQYCPLRRNILIQIFRIFQEDNSGFLNIQLLKILERLAAQLQMNIMNQIKANLQITQLNAVKLMNKQSIDIPNDNILLYFDNDDLLQQPIIMQLAEPGSIGQQAFYARNVYLDAIRMKDKTLSENLIKRAIEGIVLDQIEKPVLFNIEKISSNLCSKVITLCISGFASKEENKVDKWKCLYDQNEVFALHWECSSIKDLCPKALEILAGLALSPFEAIPLGLYAISNIINNPFTKALEEAEIVGKYLAHLILEKRIFGDCQVNLIGFSLGTHLIQHCIREMDKLQPQQKIVNNVVFLGGVADAKNISKLRLHSVGGVVLNAYSTNDMVLRYLFKLVKFNSEPCGLQEVNSKYEKKIKNKDLTQFIKGNSGYMDLMDEVLFQIDFENDLKIFY